MAFAQEAPADTPAASADEKKAEEAAPADEKKAEEAKPADEKKADEAAPADEKKADEAAPADTKTETPAPAPEEKAAEPAPAPEEKAAEPAPAAEEKAAEPAPAAEEKKAEPAAAPAEEKKAEPAAAASKDGGAASADAGKGKGKGKSKKDKDSALLGAATPVAPDVGRPWQIFATFEQTLGVGTFVSASDANQPLYGYNVSVAGTYKLTKVLDGRLDAFGQFSFDQALSVTNTAFDPTPRRFYFRDIRLGVLGRGLIQEKKYTGLIVGGNASIDLPTSEISQQMGRYFRWGVSGNIVRPFKIGPTLLLVRLAETFRHDVGSYQGDLVFGGTCAAKLEDCVSDRAAINYQLIHSLGLTFIYGNFSAGLSMAIISQRRVNQSNSELPAGFTEDMIGRSQYGEGSPWTNLTSGTVSARYAYNQYLSFALGVTTFQNPYIYREGSGNRGLRFPFFDFESTAQNLSQYFFDVAVNY